MKNRKQATSMVSIGDTLQGFEELYINPVEKGSGNDSSHLVWAEPQLFLLPLCVPQDKAADRFRSICITEKVRVGDQLKERSFRVNADPVWGLPGSFELEVMTGIYQIAAEYMASKGETPVELELGSLRSFLTRLGRPMTGKYAAMLKEALKRLAATICISEGFFYSKARDLYLVESFTFITGVKIAGETDFNGVRQEKTSIRLHEFIRENLNNNFRTLIDFEFLRCLKTDIAKPLSLHLSYRFYKQGKGTWEADYHWLAERLAVKVYADIRRAKDQLRPALKELRDTGFIEDWEWLPNGRIRFTAGRTCVMQHAMRVANKDAWLLHQEQEARQLPLIPRTQREAERMKDFDPLAAICTEYAVNGWTSSVAQKARIKQITEESLRHETIARGHTLKSL